MSDRPEGATLRGAYRHQRRRGAGRLRAALFAPIFRVLGFLIHRLLDDFPGDEEKVRAAKERSDKVDDWSEVVQRGE